MLGVVGLLARDVVDGGAPRIGGAAYHCARALAVLGRPAAVVTKYGADAHRLAAPLHGLGLAVSWRPARGTVGFRIDNRGDGRDMTVQSIGEPWSEDDVRGWVADALAGVEWVHAGALTRADFPAAVVAELARGRTLSFDGQGLVRPGRTGALRLDRDFDPEVLRHVRILKLSEEEAALLDVSELPVEEIVVTLGARGSVVYADGREEHVAAKPLGLPDPTGAGDAFAAAYLASRSGGQRPVEAAHTATALVHGLLSRWSGR